MRDVRFLAAALPIGIGLGACAQILGNDFQLASDGATTSGATTGAGGATTATPTGGAGGATTTTTGSGGSGGATTATGSGGAGGTTTTTGAGGGAATDAGAPDAAPPATCANGTKDGDETATDCGGSCAGCANGLACTKDADCLGGTCSGAPLACSGFWYPEGVQQNVMPDALTGWTVCYEDSYKSAIEAHLGEIQAQCTGPKLMLACRKEGAAAYQLLAAALRADVLFATGQAPDATHVANGVAWYYDPAFSWGFTSEGNAVNRASCDTLAGPDRLCWSTKPTYKGYRCGDDLDLDVDGPSVPVYLRTVLHAP